MSIPLRLLRIVGLSLAGGLGTLLLTIIFGTGGTVPPGFLVAVAIWVVLPIGFHTNGRHALAVDFWASILLVIGALALMFAILPKHIAG